MRLFICLTCYIDISGIVKLAHGRLFLITEVLGAILLNFSSYLLYVATSNSELLLIKCAPESLSFVLETNQNIIFFNVTLHTTTAL